MKTKLLPLVLLLLFGVVLVSFSDPYYIKRTSDANFRYEFYTTQKIVKTQDNKVYYWFKGGTIHQAQSGIAGELLHDKFIKMYHSNQLAEQGTFKKGLKIGLWKTWYPNGVLKESQYWRSGQRSGDFLYFDETGKMLQKGRYGNDLKQGKWIDFVAKDTLSYINGRAKVKKATLSKEEKTRQKELQKADKAKETKANSAVKKETNEPKKQSFINRIFTKKKPKQATNG